MNNTIGHILTASSMFDQIIFGEGMPTVSIIL